MKLTDWDRGYITGAAVVIVAFTFYMLILVGQ